MEQDKNKRLDELFKQAKNEPSKVSFEKTKEQFLSSVGNQNVTTKGIDITKFFNLKLIIMITSIITTIALVLIFKPTSTTKTVEKTNTNTNHLIPTKLVVANEKQVITEYLRKVDKLTPKSIGLNQEKEQTLLIPADSLKRYKKLLVQSTRISELLDSGYEFPKLTQEEIIANNNQKVKMLKQLLKFDKNKYVLIPCGTMEVKGKNVSLYSFYIQNTEVSVLEYRTFLFDLLIQGRKEDFLLAKPDQKLWINNAKAKSYPLPYFWSMEKYYISHPAYNRYPINNISREAANMYCKWLTKEANLINLNKKKELQNDVRLPNDVEWMYAASSGGKYNTYSWGSNSLQNNKDCYMANYKHPANINSKSRECYIKDLYVRTPSSILGKQYITTPVYSYEPNEFGLYCMNGNVAEMVYYEDENQLPGTKGGSWTSIEQELQILDENERFKGQTNPSVDIGFRPVISYFNKLINPIGTVKIKDNIYMDETEVTNFNWREYVMWLEKKHGKTSVAYKNALPDNLVWKEKESYNEPYTQYYYSHPAYNDYPVVGISYEQAVQYCKWRTERVKELFKTKALTDKKNVYPTNFEYRLPTKKEWEAAANIGYSEKTKKQLDTKYKGQLLANLKRNKEDNVVVAGTAPNNADITAPVKSYWSNAAGCYNLIGNVAEMINQQGLAKGGSWINNPNEIFIEKEIAYTKPTAWLGFRCVAEIK